MLFMSINFNMKKKQLSAIFCMSNINSAFSEGTTNDENFGIEMRRAEMKKVVGGRHLKLTIKVTSGDKSTNNSSTSCRRTGVTIGTILNKKLESQKVGPARIERKEKSSF